MQKAVQKLLGVAGGPTVAVGDFVAEEVGVVWGGLGPGGEDDGAGGWGAVGDAGDAVLWAVLADFGRGFVEDGEVARVAVVVLLRGFDDLGVCGGAQERGGEEGDPHG
jgi:hypothetical protein